MVPIEQVREILIQYFEDKRNFRLERAERFPHDVRNRTSAAALEDVADVIRALPVNHQTLQALARAPELFDGDVLHPPRRQWDGETESETDEMAARCGFDSDFISAHEWFVRWSRLLVEEAGNSEVDLDFRADHEALL